MIKVSIFRFATGVVTPVMYTKEIDLQKAVATAKGIMFFDEIGDYSKSFAPSEMVYTFLYRLLLHGKPVEQLDGSLWKMHVVTDKEERDNLIAHYQAMFASEPNKTWQIIPLELPA